MTSQLTARFESRDAAELAISRLRRSGMTFSVAKLTPAVKSSGNDLAESMVNVVFPYNQASISPLGATNGGMYPHMGMRAMMKGDPERSGGAVLRIRVGDSSLERAREILRSSHGTEIRTDSGRL